MTGSRALQGTFPSSICLKGNNILISHICGIDLYSRELTELEIFSLYSCAADLQGDLVPWNELEWSHFGDVVIEESEYKNLCEEKFEHELIAIPEPVTFLEAAFICDFLSGKIYSVDHNVYGTQQLYQTLKNKLNLKVTGENLKQRIGHSSRSTFWQLTGNTVSGH